MMPNDLRISQYLIPNTILGYLIISNKQTLICNFSPCCRYRRPVIVSLLSVGFLMIVTFLVLYWNYYETIHRRMTKKQGFILDHWGKGSPSAAETAILDIEVEILKQEEEAKLRKMLPISTEATNQDDLLMIDGTNLFDNLNGDTTTMPPMDTRVD